MQSAATIEKRTRKAQIGQFLTPAPLADFMASMFEYLPPAIRLLDAGAGAGALTLAFVSRCCSERGVDSIDVVLYEFDSQILDALRETMCECERLCMRAGIRFSYTIHAVDFVQDMAVRLTNSLFSTSSIFDIAITNPPYRKVRTGSAERLALQSVGIETSNLYAGFVSLIEKVLVQGGQMVAITPRSFCNGPYFRSFRHSFLNELNLRRIHTFESRQAAFRSDNVLQENVIFHVVKDQGQSPNVLVTSSSGESDSKVIEVSLSFEEIVHPTDIERFIHIPSALCHRVAKTRMVNLTTRLDSLGLNISTGRVVDFRFKDALLQDPGKGAVPLLYPVHFNGGTIHWPLAQSRKPNAILDNDSTRPWLVPSGMYILVKRFTSKEERRRVVACVLDPEKIEAEWYGFENHLNYFHMNGHGLPRNLAAGLFAFLNSTVVDQYFRRFSGHTQVNATDLRMLNYPSGNMLNAIGAAVSTFDLNQEQIDQLVLEHLDVHQ